MRTMYDSTNAHGMPDDGDIYCGYINGIYENYSAVAVAHPGKPVLKITVDPTVSADIYDCEKGNGVPSDVPGWINLARAQGYVPTVYCGMNTWWEAIKQVVKAANIVDPGYWIANYDLDGSSIPSGAYALQYNGDIPSHPQTYDKSVVADYWPTFDISHSASGGGVIITPTEDNDMVYGWIVSGLGAIWMVAPDMMTRVEISSPAQVDAYKAAKNFKGESVYGTMDMESVMLSRIPDVTVGSH